MERFELPEGWEWRTLGDIATVLAGTTAPQGDVYFSGGEYPFVRAQDVGRQGRTDNLVETIDRVNVFAIREKRLKQARKGAVLFPKSGASILTNSRAKLGVDAYVVSHLAIVEGNQAIVDDSWLYHWLCKTDMIALAQSESGYPSLRLSEVKMIDIPIPPLDEQNRLVVRIKDFAKRIETSRKIQQEATAEVEKMFDRAMNLVFSEENMVDWPEYPTGELFSMVSGQVSPRQSPYIDMPSVAPDNVEKGMGRLIGTIRTAGELELSSGKYLFGAEHVIYSKIRPALRKVCIPRFAGVCSADMYALKANPELITQDFLALSLLSPPFTSYAVDNSDRNAMPKINRKALFGYRMKVPDLPTQAKLTTYLLGIRDRAAEIAQLQTSADSDLAALMPAILDRAFRGEL